MKRFQNILVATDTRFNTHPIVGEAAAIAARNNARLKIVDVLKDFPWSVRMTLPDHQHYHDLLAQEKTERLEILAEPFRDQGIAVETKLLFGKASVEIIKEVVRGGHDLVMRVAKGVESRRHGFFGTTGLRLLRKCPCPVWLVTPGSTPKLEHVLGCVDTASDDPLDEELNGAVFELAQSISQRSGGRYSILNAWSIYGEEILKSHMNDEDHAALERNSFAHADSTFRKFLQAHGHTDEDSALLIRGEPGDVIPDFIRDHDVDLLVMGTIARSGVSGLIIGNTAEQILERIECSVLALKPRSFKSPIAVEV